MIDTYPENSRYDLRTAFTKWWINSRKNGGMRLTSNGYNLLTEMQYASYPFNVKKLTTPSNLLTMDKNLECPYYIDGIGCIESKIVIFGGREATIINLYGDFNSFLKTYP